MIRKISAHYIFPVTRPPVRLGILVCGDNHEILEVIDNKGKFKELPSLEFYDGILIPGFTADDLQTDRMLLDKMKTMQYQFPELTLEDIIRWATLTSAKARQCDDMYGSFDLNKRPGVNLITPLDFSSMKLTAASGVKILVPGGRK